MKPIIHLRDIHTQFGEQVIHDKLKLDIYKGEILAVVGGSGSGKSVLLRMIIGLDQPSGGAVLFPMGKPQMGVLFQYGALISSLNVIENISIPLLEVGHVSKKLAHELALIKLSLVGLDTDVAQKYPSQLSGGMIKRVALARAMALDPAVLFLDEPTSGLDPISAAGIDELIAELRQKLNITVVMVTHDLDSIANICDRVAVLVDRHVYAGTIKEVACLDHPWIESYFQGTRGVHLFGNLDGK
ncbi:MAG: ATP-binding cassette domain-containing protein [Alphaproteobacteria bacterium]